MNTNKTLAGLAVFRSLYDSEKDIYEVIASFLKEIIYKNKLHCFSDVEIAGILNTTYQFEIPIPVIKSALKRVSYIEKANGQYTITDYEQVSTVISEKETDILNNHSSILSQLYTYIQKELELEKELNQSQKNIIQASFCDFLLDNETEAEYIKFITGFILTKKEDPDFQEKLKTVREGVILHSGIRYNPYPSDRGSWMSDLTIFIDQEILFHIAGYNGEIFQEQGLELLQYIKELNHKKTKIHLKYFPETKEDIDCFFDKAEKIVKGKERLNPKITAMSEIIKGCSTGSEIQCKKDDFYNIIEKKHNIKIDKYDSYYDEKNHKYNIIDLKDYELEDDEMNNQNYNSLSYLNYVAIRRQNNPVNNFETISYILLTGKKRTQNIASEKCIKGQVPLSTNIGFLINKFWFKSNKGLSNNFPKSFNIISKCQIILSKVINDSVGEKYKELQNKIKQNKLTEEQANSRYQHLRSIKKHPEEINEEIIPEIYSFMEDDTESFLANQEKLKKNSKDLERKEKELATKNSEHIKVLKKLILSKKENLNTLKIENNKLKNNHTLLKNNREDLITKKENNKTAKVILISITLFCILLDIGTIVLFLIYKKSIYNALGINNQLADYALTFIIPSIIFLIPYIVLVITGKSYSIKKSIIKIRRKIVTYFSSSIVHKIRNLNTEIKQNIDYMTKIKKDIQNLTKEIDDLHKQLSNSHKQ